MPATVASLLPVPIAAVFACADAEETCTLVATPPLCSCCPVTQEWLFACLSSLLCLMYVLEPLVALWTVCVINVLQLGRRGLRVSGCQCVPCLALCVTGSDWMGGLVFWSELTFPIGNRACHAFACCV